MNNYRLIIQYDGGRYKGWQRLGNGEQTIQENLENILFEQLGKNIEIIGCSRTDAGVHAIALVANFKTEEDLLVDKVMLMFNRLLPNDIRILDTSLVSEHFHARYNAKGKSYLYKIWNKEYPNPFLHKYSTHVEKKLNINNMQEAAEYFIGKHDFTSFSTTTAKKKSMIRVIEDISISENNGLIQIRVKGKSFLYNMVRRIVGILIEIGLGNIDSNDIIAIIKSKERKQAGYMAEAKGLFLEYIEY